MEWLAPLEAEGDAPAARKGHTMTKLLDSPIALVFGGEDGNGSVFNDMYSLHLERREWRRIHYTQGPCPPPRLLHTATAISSSALVVLFGDVVVSHSADRDDQLTTSPANDAWIFDLNDRTWREIKTEQPFQPSPVSCHSAVLGTVDLPGTRHINCPAIYVFGGFSNGNIGSAVYRLDIVNWTWSCLPFFVTDDKGASVLMGKHEDREKPFHQGQGGPGRRESHAAVWMPKLNGMLVVGGDGGVQLFDDCWLFAPDESEIGKWRWTQLRLTIARGMPQNKLPKTAGHSLISFSSQLNKVILWGGLTSPAPNEEPLEDACYLIDLDAMQSTRVKVTGNAPEKGRLLHAVVRLNEQIFVYGGCNADGVVLTENARARLIPPSTGGAAAAAADFGPESSTVPRGENAGVYADLNEEDSGDEKDEDEEGGGEEYMPLVGPSPIPRGTPLSGRVIDVAKYGYFVSVVIKGKLYKGVIVANPLKDASHESDESSESSEDETAQPEAKRQRRDPVADLLPDHDDLPRKSGDEVIDVDID